MATRLRTSARWISHEIARQALHDYRRLANLTQFKNPIEQPELPNMGHHHEHTARGMACKVRLSTHIPGDRPLMEYLLVSIEAPVTLLSSRMGGSAPLATTPDQKKEPAWR